MIHPRYPSLSRLMLCIFLGLMFLIGCEEGVRYPANAKPVSMGIFEVIGCKGAATQMTLQGSTEKYCIAANPIVDEKDVRLAQATRQSGRPTLLLGFTIKTGERMREATERIYQDHLRRSDEAKLGIVVDGKLITVAALSGPIGDSLQLTALNWEDTVQLAASLMASRPPPSPSPSGHN